MEADVEDLMSRLCAEAAASFSDREWDQPEVQPEVQPEDQPEGKREDEAEGQHEAEREDRDESEDRDEDGDGAWRDGVRAVAVAVLDGVARRRLPGPDDLVPHREWGRRLGESGAGAARVADACHTAGRRVWDDLSERARAHGVTGELISRAGLCWAWVHALSAAAIQGHTADTSVVDTAARLVEALFTGRTGDANLAGQARRLGFDPDGTFQVVCCRPAPEPETAEALHARLRTRPGAVAVAVRPGLVVVLFQGGEPDGVVGALGPAYAECLGLGLSRTGLDGAAESLTDAEAALRLSVARGRPVSFEDEWMPIILMLDADRLAPLVSASAGAPAHLEEAVVLWAYSDFSIPVAARRLHLHPNTLKYRLDRWREVTGWDPRVRRDLELTLLHHNLNTVQGRDRR